MSTCLSIYLQVLFVAPWCFVFTRQRAEKVPKQTPHYARLHCLAVHPHARANTDSVRASIFTIFMIWPFFQRAKVLRSEHLVRPRELEEIWRLGFAQEPGLPAKARRFNGEFILRLAAVSLKRGGLTIQLPFSTNVVSSQLTK